jgi:alpha-L-fucosidase 2
MRALIGLFFLLALSGFAEVRNDVEFSRVSGETLTLDAHIPDGPGPFAAVILVHGGGWTAGSKRANFVLPLFPTLDRSGLAWFSIDYRLAPKYPHPAALRDVEQAIRFVKSHAREFRVDPTRLALMGESAGGHLVGLAGVHPQPDTAVAAVVDFYGAFDLEAMVVSKGQASRGFRDFLGVTDLSEKSRAVLRKASPSTYVKAGMPPFLLLHGTEDQAVPYSQSVQFCEQLKLAGNACDLYTVPGGIHGVINWEKNPSQHAYKDVVIRWLRKTLRVETPPVRGS